jgi:hypothetical protein
MHRSEGVGCARGEGSSGEGLSGSRRFHAAHNTSFTLSRRYVPLATAGEVVGLWERRWTPLRRPCGRLSGRRETLNVIRHISNSCKRHQSGSSCIRTVGRIQASLGSSRRAPPGASLCRTRPRPRRGARHALPRGIVRRTAIRSPTQSGAFQQIFRESTTRESGFTTRRYFRQSAGRDHRLRMARVRRLPVVSLGGAFGKRRRYRQPSARAAAGARPPQRRRITVLPDIPTRSLSKTTRLEQIVGARVPQVRARMYDGEPMRQGEGVGCVCCERSSGEDLSGSAVTDAAHNTSFTLSRRFAPLATAGEVVGLE